MADPGPEPVYLRVLLHFRGNFVRDPASYVGETYLVTDMDFAAMNLAACVEYLDRFIGEPIEKLFYAERHMPLELGVRWIEDDADYALFLDTGYEEPDLPISMYIDHSGDGIADLFNSDNDESGGVTECEEERPTNDKEPVADDPMDIPNDKEPVADDPPVELGEDPQVELNRTNEDEFLGLLCVPNGRDEETDTEEDSEDETCQEPTPIFNPKIAWKLQEPVLGMRFENPKQLKEMLCNYAVSNGYQLCFSKNDRTRLLVECCKGSCPFRLWATWMSTENSFQIKSLKPDHQCARNFKIGAIVTFEWIGSHYTKDILHRQKLTIRQLRLEVVKKFGIEVSLSQCRRAKKHALRIIEGTLVEHYAKLWSYGAELRRSNPGSTVQMDVNSMPDGKNYFQKFYVCFDGVKRGWIDGCRKVICLDGCFLKGIVKGELLAAVGKDANNQIYPIAWAVVCVENKENWKWFLELVGEDLRLGTGLGITLMSDQHKGLMEAVKEVLPHAEHRQCARHIVANFTKRFAGAHFENLFWKACNSTTEQSFKEIMQQIDNLSPAASKYLMDKNPKSWSMAYYETGMCDANVENGTSESFNAVIVDARRKPIISMLEELRLYMMDKLYKAKQRGWTHDVSPAIRLKINELKKQQRYWQVLASGLNEFETRSGNEAYVVNIDKKTCSCRLWQLNGYGCVHSVAALSYLNRDAENYVDSMFTRDMYLRTYAYQVFPMNGSKMWPATTNIPPLPPISRRMPGRPKTKRVRDAREGGANHKLSKKGRKGLCSLCHEEGHNRRCCPTLGRGKRSKLPVHRADTTQVMIIVLWYISLFQTYLYYFVDTGRWG